jgi:hypothetical protein
MKSKTHVYMANLLIEDLRANKIVLPGVGNYTPPAEVRDAVLNHPGAFRAGAVGPDFYPDMLLGQAVIHPEKSGMWLDLMFKRLLMSSVAEREKNLSFTLGYMIHYAGDMFGHAYVNAYAGGWFPPYAEIVQDSNKAKIVARHMLVESYMDQKVPADASMSLSPPIEFIRDVFTCDDAQRLMKSFGVDNSIQNPLGEFIKLRKSVHSALLDTSIGMLPLVTDYVQHWEEDVDTGIKTWLEAWCQTADAFTGSRTDVFSYVKGTMENWFLLKFTSMIGIPDFVGEVISFLKDLNILKPLKDYIKNLFKDFLVAIAKTILGGTYATIEQAIEVLQKVFKDPKTYLDNGVVFSEKNISQKLDRDFGNYGQERATTKQTFHAVYQCLNMSKLCLIGADNLNTVVKNAGGSSLYASASFAPAAKIDFVTVKTGTSWGAGTDNNVYIGIRYNGNIYETLCDKPNYNDFESGDLDTYAFAVPENVDIKKVDAITARMSGNTPFGDWECAWIELKDKNEQVLVRSNEAFKLSTGNTKIITNITKRNIPAKSVCLDSNIMSFLWSLDGKGKDNSNPAKQAQWEINFVFYSDRNLREKVFNPMFKIPYNPQSGTLTGLQTNIGEIVDRLVFLYDNGDIINVGGSGGNASNVSTLKSGEHIISVAYTKCRYPYWAGSISKVEYKSNSGSTYIFKGSFYQPSRDDPTTTVVNAPSGKYIASFKGSTVTINGNQYLSSVEIGELRDL